MKFRGKSRRNLDAKGRLMLSPEFRSSLALRMKTAFEEDESQVISDTNSADANLEEAQAEKNANIKFFVTTYDGCLFAIPYDQWSPIEDELSNPINSSPEVRKLKRLFVGNAEEHVVDSQGRILLSADHREFAGIEKEVFVVGQINHFEIWNPERYKQAIESDTGGDLSEELRASGINFPF